MNFSKSIRTLISVSIFTLISCEYSIDRLSSHGVYPLLVEELNIITPATSEVVNGEFKLKAEGVGNYGCLFDGVSDGPRRGLDWRPISSSLQNENMSYRFLIEGLISFEFQRMMLSIEKSGGPAGAVRLELYEVNEAGGIGTHLETSSPVMMGSLNGEVIFNFPSILYLDRGQRLWGVIKLDGSMDGANAVYMSGGVAGEVCTDFSRKSSETSDGVNWTGVSGIPYYSFEVDKYHSSAYAEWTLELENDGSWDLSSLKVPESKKLPNGAVLYSVGVSSNGTPTYEIVERTLAEVQSAGAIKGKFLHIRVHLKSTEDGFSSASILSGFIRLL